MSQFMVDGLSMSYRQDRYRNGGGIIVYIRDDIPSKLLMEHVFPDDIEDFKLSSQKKFTIFINLEF